MSIARQLTDAVAVVAKRTAQQQSPLIEVTVISRNPDGSLNVDDGKGGCLRMAPKANVRIGQKIKLGTEPGLGQQTNLPLVTLTIDPSTVPCPSDWRDEDGGGCEDLIGAPCVPPVETETEPTLGDHQSFQFLTRINPDHPEASWADRLVNFPPNGGTLIATTVGVTVEARRYSGSIVHSGFPSSPYPDEVRLRAVRSHNLFDTSGVPSGRVSSAVLTVHFAATGPPFFCDDLGDEVLYVVPGYSDGTASVLNWFAFDPTPVAGIRLADIMALGGGGGLDVEIPLHDAEGGVTLDELVQRGPGAVTGLMLIFGRDLEPAGVVTPQAPSGTLPPVAPYTGLPSEVDVLEGGAYSFGIVSLLVVTGANSNA